MFHQFSSSLHLTCRKNGPLCVTCLLGGLMLLEGSHRRTDVRETCGQMDVDTYCVNTPEEREIRSGEYQWAHRHNNGHFLIG